MGRELSAVLPVAPPIGPLSGSVKLTSFIIIIFKDFIYLFLERGEGGEKERERNINVWLPLTWPPLETWPATQACALAGNQTSDPLVCRPALNPLSHTSQGFTSFNRSFDAHLLDVSPSQAGGDLANNTLLQS